MSVKINSLRDALTAIKEKTINYGENGDYYFLTDEDGILFFLRRDLSIKGEDEEIRDYWSQYCDEVIFSIETGDNRGLDITTYFLNALDIEYSG